MKIRETKYIISFDWKNNILPMLLTLIFGAITYLLYSQNTVAYIFTGVLAIFCLGITIVNMYRTLFKKIIIYNNSFTHINSPLKDSFFMDYEIEDAWISDRHLMNGTTIHYFHYTTKDGRKGKLLFQPSQYDYADYLVERLKGNNVTDYEEHLDAENHRKYKKSDIPKGAGLFERFFVYSNKGVVIVPIIAIALLAIIWGNMFINTGKKTPYTTQQVQEVLQSYNYTTYDATEELQKQNSKIVKGVSGKSNNPYLEFLFIELDSDSSAKSLYTSLYKQLWEKHDPHTIIGSSYYNNYSSHEFHDEDDYYHTIVRVSNTVVYASSKEGSKSKIYEILIAMDYDDKTDKQ